MDVEVVGISNVLGTQKELIFNLQVRARYFYHFSESLYTHPVCIS
jgi:hypothetical protein